MRKAVIDTDREGNTGIFIFYKWMWIWWPVGIVFIVNNSHMEKELKDELLGLKASYGHKILIIDKRK
jgi:hypothetical protein